MDLQIEGRHTDVTAEWTSDIQARVGDLRPGHDIQHVRVTLSKNDHRKAEDSYDVVIVVQIPGHTITARKQQGSFEEAIRDAFAAMETELEKIREKRGAHEVRVTAPPERGVVSKLFRDKGMDLLRWRTRPRSISIGTRSTIWRSKRWKTGWKSASMWSRARMGHRQLPSTVSRR